MNESILTALMQMFAIAASLDPKDDSFDNVRGVVSSYLRQQLSQQYADKFLKLFDEYLAVQTGSVKNTSDSKQRKRNSSNFVKVLRICEEINESLQQHDKVIVVIRLLEFVGKEVTDKELDFINTVADTFYIPEPEYKALRAFVLYDIDRIEDKSHLMYISSDAELPENLAGAKFMHEKNLRGSIRIIRMASTNMLFFKYVGDGESILLNNAPTNPGKTYLLGNGSVIKNSKISPIYFSNISSRFILDEQKARIEFCADNIEFHYPNSKNGIQKFSFFEESGNLIGIMGGSGVGKSTLLNLLIGNYSLAGGRITINGYDYAEKSEKLKGVIGYVPQDDLLIEELTVYQNLYFNAKLCFDKFTEEQIKESVNKILVEMDLYEIRNLKVGGPLNKFISGGQRKRLNIALELMREPSVLIADEPTSGLSSADSEMVMTLLKEQTFKAKLVIVNIHQPSSDIYKMFDKILVMDRGGYPAYYGNPLDAIVYFKTISGDVAAEQSECPTCGNVNPEQLLYNLEAKMVDEYGKLTRTRKVSPQEWYDMFNEKITPKIEEHKKNFDTSKKKDLPDNNFQIPSLWSQFKIFVQRNVLSKITDKQYMLINLLESPLLAFILAYFIKYFSGTADDPGAYVFANNENIPAYIFICVICSLFIGLTVSAEEIIRDRMILSRERFLNLSWFSYINSKVAVLFTISAIQTISFVLVGNFVLEIHGLTWQYWLVLFTTSAFANMLGLNISSALSSVVNIYITIPFIIVPELLFSGVMVSFSKIHKNVADAECVPIVGDIMTSRWAYEALALEQFENNLYNQHFYLVEREISQNNYNSSFLVPALRTRIENAKRSLKLNEDKDRVEKDLRIVKNMVADIVGRDGQRFGRLDEICPEKFNDTVANELLAFLDDFKALSEQLQYEASERKDLIYEKLLEDMGGRENVVALQMTSQNKRLDEYLLNKNDLDKIIESKSGRLIQMKDPAYHKARFRNGRSHFYAPVKRVGDTEIPTFWFNIAFIWLTTVFFYVALNYTWLKKLLDFLGNLKILNYKRK